MSSPDSLLDPVPGAEPTKGGYYLWRYPRRTDKFSLVRPLRLTEILVIGDVLSFDIQGSSVGFMVVQKPDLAKWVKRIVIIGLLVQVILFGLFCVIALVFYKRMRGGPTPDSFNNSIP
ncbi:RTM1 [Tolypocladium paradoxum]|uniref:RTM1 n=1 Tax=Tolypocladium paradoxum TaxID=94208 RepID=A0A2S4KXN9_9HYPO|nr:RTM1 [Tolypocladium paradoxum]